jgi:hypothetical protein|uniref:Uncharacterized protein n=2 Tax=unclassified Mycobacterium TaxID=2642494 RepID=A0A5Q5BSY2_MYCSS
MITELAPMMLDGTASGAAAQVTYVAAPIWDIGANIKNQGIQFAVFLLLGGSAVVSSVYYLVSRNKTAALKTLAIGVVLAGLVSSLPSLGVMSKDTVGGLTNSGTR